MGFKVGDKVVYPSQGVTVVEAIEDEDLAGMTVSCFHLKLLATDSKVVVPVQNVERVGLRPLSDQETVSDSLVRLKANLTNEKGDWKDRYRANLERLKTGELGEVVDVLLCLADVASRKTLSFRERKMFDQAQQILAHECGLCNTIDPLAGSYYVESLTSEIEKRASEYLKQIDAVGGMLRAIENGFVFKEIQESSVKFQQRVDSGDRVIVGLNKYSMPDENDLTEPDIFEIDPKVEDIQKKKSAEVKAHRTVEDVDKSLDHLQQAIDNNENLMPYIIAAVKSYATIGEICGIMRNKWGEFQASTYV